MLHDLISEDVVKTDVDAKTWREVVEICGDLLVKEEKIEPAFIRSMIQTVEDLGPYMILVPKVAFFHGSPSSAVKEVCLSLVTLKNNVIFDDFDNQEITCAFGFGAKDSDSHMNVLMQLAELLQDEEFLELVRNNGSKEAIMKKINQY